MARKKVAKKKEPAVKIDSSLSEEEQRQLRIQASNQQISDTYGQGIVGRASSMLHKRIPRIPLRVMPLDIALGGGIPIGRMSMFWGDEASGKTTLAKRLIGTAQSLCANCWNPAKVTETNAGLVYKCSCKRGYRKVISGWMDAEGAFDQEWARIHGVNLDSMLYSQPEYAEQCVDVVDAWIRTGDIDIIVIDSLAALTPIDEIEKSTEDTIVGRHAQLLTKATRKWGSALNTVGKKFGRRPTIVTIQQIRKKIGIMWGSPDTMGGGEAQKFMASVIVKLTSGPTEMDKDIPLWTTKRFKIHKTRVSPPHKSGEYAIAINDLESGKRVGDILEEDFVFDEMSRRRLFKYEKEGGRIILLDGQRLNGKGQVVKYWMESPNSFEKCKSELLTASYGVE